MDRESIAQSVKVHETYADASKAASEEAASTMSTVVPAVVYRQGGRSFIATSFPLTVVANRVKLDPLQKGGDPDQFINRPLIPEHVRSIYHYLTKQEEYILPGITLSTLSPLRCHVVAGAYPMKLGFLVLPESIRFQVTDGQHRIKALQEAIRDRPSLADDAIAVTIIQEGELDRIHQDFVDCAQVKPIPAALLTVFNQRDPLAKLTRLLAEDVAAFRGRIEKAAKTVGKNSVNLFTMNQLRIGVAELLTGDSMQAGPSLKKAVEERLGSEEQLRAARASLAGFYSSFTDANAEWALVAGAGSHRGHDRVDAADLRRRFVHFTATGLVVIGRIGYHILMRSEPEQARLIAALGGLDWARSAALWQDGLVAGDKILTSRIPIEHAIARAKQTLGMDLTERDRRRLSGDNVGSGGPARGPVRAGTTDQEKEPSLPIDWSSGSTDRRADVGTSGDPPQPGRDPGT